MSKTFTGGDYVFEVGHLPLRVAIEGTDKLRLDADLGAGAAQWFSDQFADVTKVWRSGEPAHHLKSVQDDVFAGNLVLWEQWLAFCIEMEFSGFLAERAQKRRAAQLQQFRDAKRILEAKAERTDEEETALRTVTRALEVAEQEAAKSTGSDGD